MSKIALTPNGSGSGVFTIASPNSNTNRTITLPDESVTLGAGTPSIDDNGDATAMTITSDETVLIGKTTTAIGTAGHRINGLGYYYATRAMGSNGTDPVFIANILNNDGNAIEIYKDSNKVGGTGVVGGNDLFIAGGATGIRFDSDVAKIYPTNGTGAVSNGAVDIGEANFRFKDAYLSGGVYLGGTGSANKLEDYEVGTFTPVLEFGGGNTNITYSTRSGFYTKIGNVVYFYAECQLSSRGTSTGNLAIRDLPFSPQRTATSVSVLTGSLSSVNDIQIFLSTNGKINFENRNTGTQSSLTHNNVNSNSTFFVSGTYQTSG